MSTLRTYNLQSIDSGSANIQLSPNAGAIFTGLTTAQSGLNVTGGAIVGGGLTVTGVLTYDDVTNIDSIGIVTARTGLTVTSGLTDLNGDLDVAGISTFRDDVKINYSSGIGLSITNEGNFSTADIHLSGYRNLGNDGVVGEIVVLNRQNGESNDIRVLGNGDFRFRHDGNTFATFTGTGVSFAQDLTLPNQERFLAYKTGNQTENDNTSVVVGQAAAVYDTANGWDDLNNKYVVQNSGFFLLIANIAITSNTANELRDAAISIERSTDSGSNWTPIATSGMRANTTADTDGLTLHIVLPYNLNAGDWLRVGAYGNTDAGGSYIIEDNINDIIGGDLTVSGAAADYDDTATYFSVVKLA